MNIPTHLKGTQASGIQENQSVAQFEVGSGRNFVYLILDWRTKKAAWVDPQLGTAPIFEELRCYGFEWVAVLLTHTHLDHIAGIPELIRSIPGVPIFVHFDEIHRLDPTIRKFLNIRPVQDLDFIAIGQFQVQVLHTPGHSAGECCYFLESPTPYLFSGDAVLISDCGRTDLETGNNDEMFQSLQRIKMLPSHCIVLPGHHYQVECASTIERELRESPPFLCKSSEELLALP